MLMGSNTMKRWLDNSVLDIVLNISYVCVCVGWGNPRIVNRLFIYLFTSSRIAPSRVKDGEAMPCLGVFQLFVLTIIFLCMFLGAGVSIFQESLSRHLRERGIGQNN